MGYMIFTYSKLDVNCITCIFMTSFLSFYFDQIEQAKEFLMIINKESKN